MTRRPGLPIGSPKRRACAEECARLYRGGMPVRTVAQRLGLSYGLAHNLLVEAGVEMRSRGGRYRVGRR